MEVVRFGELYSIPSGNGLSRPSAVRGEGYPMIGMGELFEKDIITDMKMDRVQMSEREKKTFLVEADDLLFARQSLVAAGAGKCSIVKELSEPTTYESHLIRVRLDKQKCNPWFYYYLFKLPDNPIKAIVNQCAQAGIRGNELVKIKVPFQERRIQDRIASILSAYDNLIEVNNKRIKVLEQMAENLYKEWFVRFRFPGHETAEFENGLPKGWEIRRIEEIGEVVGGGTPSTSHSEYWDGTIPWLTPADLASFTDVYISHGESFITEEGLKKSSTQMLPRLTVLLSSRAPIGYVAIAKNELCTNQGFKSIICNHDLALPHYLFYFLKLNGELLECYASGSTFLELSSGRLKQIKLVVPTIEIQRRFESTIEPWLLQAETLISVNRNLIKQRDLLLPRLMSGKLEV